eukprot:5327291-Prymnesium_polylepis.1
MACSARRVAAVCMAATMSNPQGALPLSRICSVIQRKGCASRGRGGWCVGCVVRGSWDLGFLAGREGALVRLWRA